MAGESEVTAVANISEKGARLAADIVKALLAFLQKKGGEIAYDAKSKQETHVELKSGIVQQSKLMEYAHQNRESVVVQGGIKRSDISAIKEKSKEYGIAVSVTGQKNADNLKISVLESDKGVLNQIMTDIVKERIQQNPNELASFKVKSWEVEPLKAEFQKHDLASYFVQDNNGDIHCIYESKDKKAFDIAKNEFKKAHKDVVEDFNIRGDDGFTIIKDEVSGREISFDEVLSKNELINMIQENFGYDEVKANIAANKYASSLPPNEQSIFLNNNPMHAVNTLEYNIKLENESILLNDLNFVHMNLKEDGADCLVIMDNEGRTLTLTSDVKNAEMAELINTRLGITDKATVEAISEKVDTVRDIYLMDNDNNLTHSIDTKDGITLGTCEINRTNKDKFEATFNSKKYEFSFSDKKGAVQSLRGEFLKVGQTDENALKSARSIYNKARMQSAVKLAKEARSAVKLAKEARSAVENTQNTALKQPYRIEREIGGSFTVSNGERTEKYSLSDKSKTINKMCDDFKMSSQKAGKIFDKANKQSGVENAIRNQSPIKKAPAAPVKSPVNKPNFKPKRG